MNTHELLGIVGHAFALLGRSEKHPDIADLMSGLGLSMPIPRPARGEAYIGFESRFTGLDLNFKYFSASRLPPSSYGEDEMYLADLFVDVAALGFATEDMLPMGVTAGTSRAAARSRWGAPEWSSIPRLRADRWLVDGHILHLTFNANEDGVKLVTYSASI